MANQGLTTRIPIWVRVPLIITLVLVGMLITTMLLDFDAGGGGHGSGDGTEMIDPDHSGGDRGSGGDHSGGDRGSGGDHSGGDRGSGGDHSGGGTE